MTETFQALDRHYSSIGAQIDAIKRTPESPENEDIIEQTIAMRSAISGLGLSAYAIGHISDDESKQGNGLMTMASYHTTTNKIHSASVEHFINEAKEASMSTREFTNRVMLHEQAHQTSRQAEGVEKTDGILVHLFGENAIHVTEEATASVHPPFDAYGGERSKMRQYEITLGGMDLKKARLEGDHEAIEDAAIEAGLIPEEERAPDGNWYQ